MTFERGAGLHEFRYKTKPLLFSSLKAPNLIFKFCNHDKLGVCTCACAYAQLEAVEKELNRLETAGIIKNVTNSDWATPLVIVPKADSSVRLCGDYRVTVNNVIESNTYPFFVSFEEISGK